MDLSGSVYINQQFEIVVFVVLALYVVGHSICLQVSQIRDKQGQKVCVFEREIKIEGEGGGEAESERA